MKAPEKLYFGESDNGILEIYSNKESNDEIEYIRTDAFINKAATWFANRYQANGSYLCADDIEDFIKTLKGG